jgi:hypothetical protein
LISKSRIVVAIRPAGRRAKDAALHFAVSAISAAVGPFGTGIGPAAWAAAIEPVTSMQATRWRERVSDSDMGGLESMLPHAGTEPQLRKAQ